MRIAQRSNYAFNPIAEQVLRSNQTVVPQRVNAALAFNRTASLSWRSRELWLLGAFSGITITCRGLKMRKMGILLVNMLCLVLYTGKAFSQDVRLYPVAEVVRVLATSFEPGTTDYVVIMQHALMARGRIRDEKQFREEIGKSGALGKVRLETVTQSSGDSSESEVFNVTAEMQSRNLVKPKATRSRLRNDAELSALVQGVLEGAGCTAISQHSKSGYGSGSFVVKYRWRCPSTVLEVASLLGKLESDSAGLALDHLGIHAGRKMENGGDAIDVAFDALVNIGVEG